MIRTIHRRLLLSAFVLSTAFLVIGHASAVTASTASTHTFTVTATDLKAESMTHPFGIDTRQPQLSWILEARAATGRGLGQTAYRLLVSSSLPKLSHDHGDLWDSGKIASDQTFGIPYQGVPMASGRTYFWKVEVWDRDGHPSPWSAPSQWTTSLLDAGDWKARWIAATHDNPSLVASKEQVTHSGSYPPPLPIFRREFRADKPVKQAIAFVTGLGQYELRINGRSVTTSVLNPGWTNYRKTILYNSYDVTGLIAKGSNVLGVLLGNGMYNVEETKGRYTKFVGSFGQPKLLLQLTLTYADDTVATIVSDNSWKTTAGPIAYSSTYGGEDYDAQREQPGWDRPAFIDRRWDAAIEVASPGGQLIAQVVPPIAIDRVYRARTITHPAPDAIVYDLGHNFAGWPEIRVHGPRGARVTLTCGELLDDKGLVSQHSANASPGNANLFTYTLRGDGIETWHPRFSYWGFRYVQVNGASPADSKSKPVVLSVDGEFLHAAAPVVGHFTTSNLLFTRIHKLIDMAILSNMVSVLTDCPHREKLGWLEQTHLAGSSIFYNYDVSGLYAKMARDMRDSQLPDGLVPAIAPEYVAFVDDNGVSNSFRDSPEWGSASILSPWTAYQFNADRMLLAESFPSMTRYADYLRSKMKDGMLTYGLGDWYDIGPKPPGESQLTQKGLTATATYFEDLKALESIATILDKPVDAANFQTQAESVRESINMHLLHADTGQYDLGSQTANAMPLALSIVPPDQRTSVLQHLADNIEHHQYQVTAGDIGFHYVVRALTDGSRNDILNAMLLRKEPPSYGYQLQRGATTLTEAWDTNPNSSQNHFMLGHAEEWFYRGLAGIDFDMSRSAPARILIRPSLVPGTNDASATYDSVLGTIGSSWSRRGKQIRMDVTIPPGASATVLIPTGNENSIRESGRIPVKDESFKSSSLHGATSYILGSGHYHFTFVE